ncbi:expressed unknown protein [Seminavis robusta]|uniref:Uncharacterized protein n=1 Tax=Seminavis robusta TaxID=568900 RepID=A0A9N8HRC0_9STRA|nr:expressed unknown protein [Seminavis robusta]|eukprot:Sro1256_g256571.1  (105) ;mRNA; f:1625-1939
MKEMSLRSNEFDAPQFDAPLPSELGQLTDFFGLWLNDCNITGSIPSEFGLMSSLQVLNLRNNSLGGVVPSELGRIEQLRELDLSSLPLLSGSFPFDTFVKTLPL